MIYTIDKIKQKNDTVILNLTPKDAPIPNYKPGQFAMLAIHDKDGEIWQRRPFSICSSPLNKKYLQFAIKVHGEFTQKITTLKNGEAVDVSTPNGFFIFNETRMKKTVFLAGGIGITPFISALRYISDKKLDNEAVLLYSNKTKEDIVFYEELKSIAEKNKNIKVVFVLTKEDSPSSEYEKGRIDKLYIEKYCSPFEEKYFSICGPSKFMESLSEQLAELGIPKDYIDMERFN